MPSAPSSGGGTAAALPRMRPGLSELAGSWAGLMRGGCFLWEALAGCTDARYECSKEPLTRLAHGVIPGKGVVVSNWTDCAVSCAP